MQPKSITGFRLRFQSQLVRFCYFVLENLFFRFPFHCFVSLFVYCPRKFSTGTPPDRPAVVFRLFLAHIAVLVTKVGHGGREVAAKENSSQQ